jgi:hypothetical protein
VHAAAWKKLFDAFLERRADETGESFVPFDIDAASATAVPVRERRRLPYARRRPSLCGSGGHCAGSHSAARGIASCLLRSSVSLRLPDRPCCGTADARATAAEST